MKYMGKCAFLTFEEADAQVERWAKGYFGRALRGFTADSGNFITIGFEADTELPLEKVEALYKDTPYEGAVDPDYCKTDCGMELTLPYGVARKVIQRDGIFLEATGLARTETIITTEYGIFLMEEGPDICVTEE